MVGLKIVKVERPLKGVDGKPYPTNEKGNKAYLLVVGGMRDGLNHVHAINGGEPTTSEGDLRGRQISGNGRRSSWS